MMLVNSSWMSGLFVGFNWVGVISRRGRVTVMLDASIGELGAGTGAALLLLVSALPWERVLWSEGVVVGIFPV